VVDPTYGYRRLDPLPSDSEFERFYESRYYDLLRRGGRAPDLRRLLAGGEEGERERRWLGETLYADVGHAIETHGPGKRVLDVGCGQGELLHWLADHGFEAQGIEPSEEATAIARERDLDARAITIDELVGDPDRHGAYDAVVMLNVLEHVPEPVAMLEDAGRLLAPGGLLYLKVPNDFNPLQLAAQRKLDCEEWWVAVPDHVNYFDVESLCALGRRLGFEPLDVQADSPMELFLLMGLDYVADPELGATCHGYRVEAELSMPAELRRALFSSYAASGIGRNVRAVLGKEVDDTAR